MASVNPNSARRPTAQQAGAAHQAASGVHPNYQVIINVEGDPAVMGNSEFPIVANLPERYHIDFSSTWSSPFAKNYIQGAASAVLGPLGGGVVDLVSKATGISTKLKSESVQVWETSSPLSFSIDLIFVARTNSEKDIRAKHLALLKLAAPSEVAGMGGQVLRQPGPVILNSGLAPGTRKISMGIGNYIFLDNIVVNSVSSDVSTLCDKDGIPQHMVINIGVSSFFACFTTQDLDKAFKMPSEGGAK